MYLSVVDGQTIIDQCYVNFLTDKEVDEEVAVLQDKYGDKVSVVVTEERMKTPVRLDRKFFPFIHASGVNFTRGLI